MPKSKEMATEMGGGPDLELFAHGQLYLLLLIHRDAEVYRKG